MTRMVSPEAFASFIADQRAKIGNAFQEVEQVQVEYQGAYTRFKAEHDKTLLALANQIETQDDGLGDALKAQIDARVPIEKQTIVQRITALEKEQIPKLQEHADDLLARARKEIADLREMNPKLNEQEESLKADLARLQQQLDDLNAQVKKLGSGLGFIFNAWKIHSLDRERFQVIGRMQSTEERLKKVRQDWKDLRDMVTKEEMEWKMQWQVTTAQVGQLRQERDYLAQNMDAEARHRANVYVLDNLKALSAGTDSTPLKQMVDLDIQTDNFQAALGSVASMLGVLKGIDEGLGRMNESVSAIIAEQNRHGAYLGGLSIVLQDSAVAFGQTWDDLIAKVKDEKTLATHPADFVAAMKPFLDERLTKEHIVALFDMLGNALKEATQNWRGQ